MGFIRVKRIKGNRYAYAVENKWKKDKGPRQRVKEYLGKAISFDIVNEIVIPIKEEESRREIVQRLASNELIKRGFAHNGENLEKCGISFNEATMRFFSGGKEIRIAIEMNDGFLCSYMLERILLFKVKPDEDEREAGTRLAKLFVGSGLKPDDGSFVRFYQLS